MRNIILLSSFFLSIFNIKAQETPEAVATTTTNEVFHFASTRPAFSEGALLVPTGKAQIEIGADYRYFKGNAHEITHPTFHLKYGISKYFEFRINGDATTYTSAAGTQTGLHPLFIGMKLKMIDAKHYAPASSFIGGLSVNYVSTKNFRTKFVAPYFKITLEQFLPKNVGLVYNYGLIWNGEDAKPTYQVALATSYTTLFKSTPEKQKQLKYFFELYALYPHGEKFDLRINNGLAFLFNRFIQFDFSIGAGVLKNSPRVVSSLGLTVRFPKKDKKKE